LGAERRTYFAEGQFRDGALVVKIDKYDLGRQVMRKRSTAANS